MLSYSRSQGVFAGVLAPQAHRLDPMTVQMKISMARRFLERRSSKAALIAGNREAAHWASRTTIAQERLEGKVATCKSDVVARAIPMESALQPCAHATSGTAWLEKSDVLDVSAEARTMARPRGKGVAPQAAPSFRESVEKHEATAGSATPGNLRRGLCPVSDEDFEFGQPALSSGRVDGSKRRYIEGFPSSEMAFKVQINLNSKVPRDPVRSQSPEASN